MALILLSKHLNAQTLWLRFLRIGPQDKLLLLFKYIFKFYSKLKQKQNYQNVNSKNTLRIKGPVIQLDWENLYFCLQSAWLLEQCGQGLPGSCSSGEWAAHRSHTGFLTPEDQMVEGQHIFPSCCFAQNLADLSGQQRQVCFLSPGQCRNRYLEQSLREVQQCFITKELSYCFYFCFIGFFYCVLLMNYIRCQ